jgi:hypothetical protein
MPILGRPVKPGDDTGDVGHAQLRILTARLAPELMQSLPPELEGAGNAGCAVRTHSLACENKKTHESVTTGTPQSTGIPRAMVLTASFVLSSATGLSCHRRSRITIRKLDISVGMSGPHDFSVREQGHSSRDLPRPPRPLPNVHDDRETPLLRARDRARCAADLGLRSISAGCGRLARRANQIIARQCNAT